MEGRERQRPSEDALICEWDQEEEEDKKKKNRECQNKVGAFFSLSRRSVDEDDRIYNMCASAIRSSANFDLHIC